MARYSWNESTLLGRIDKLDKMIEKETDEKELAKLYYYYDMLNAEVYNYFYMPYADVPLTKRMPDLYGLFLGNNRYYKMLDVYYDAIKDNIDLISENEIKRDEIIDQINDATKAYVTKEKAISICYDFYNELDEELYEHFKSFYDKRFNHLHFFDPKLIQTLEYGGVQYYMYGINESFIDVAGSNNPYMIVAIIHEIAHAIDNYMNPDGFFDRSYFSEVTSLFMQLVAYYKKVGNFGELYYYYELLNYLSSFYIIAIDGYTYSNIMDTYSENQFNMSKEFFEKIKNCYGKNRNSFYSFMKKYNPHHICYPISMSLALNFFDIYKKDEKKGIEKLKEFINTNNKEDYFHLFLSDEFTETVSNSMKNILINSKECFERHIK